jgi:hypothetical protein
VPVPAALAGGLEEDVVGDDVGGAPAAEHSVEQHERVPDLAAHAEGVHERVVGVGAGRHGHPVHDAARLVEPPRAAVPVGQGAVGDGGGRGAARLDDARGVRGAAPAAEVADELVGELDVGREGGGVDDAERRVEVAAVDERSQAAFFSAQTARRVGVGLREARGVGVGAA